jgi:hypothetical protein
MPSYEIDAGKLTAKAQKALNEQALHIVFEPAKGRVLVRADEELAPGTGIREIPDAEFEVAGGVAAAAPAGPQPLAGASRLEASKLWKVVLKSPRKATLHWMAAGGDDQALGVALGEGRGDRVEIVRPFTSGQRVKGVSLKVQARIASSEQCGVGVVLTSESERPWLAKGPMAVMPQTWTALSYDFSDIEEGKVRRAEALVIAITTQADQGVCLIKDVTLLG